METTQFAAGSLDGVVGLPTGPFRCIVADPPWPYSGDGPVGTGGRGAAFVRDLPHPGSAKRYGKMSMDELKAMPIHADATAHLYLWTTNGFLREAHDLAEAWGFKPKTVLTWGKVKADGTASMKTGYYFRGATEHCLFAVRGSLRLQGMKGRPTLYLSRRLPHSVKPDWFYALCEECSPGPRLELFARRERPGWTVWGNEVGPNPGADRMANEKGEQE
jgi:N6-adenosine-specific RNA methylase IME4